MATVDDAVLGSTTAGVLVLRSVDGAALMLLSVVGAALEAPASVVAGGTGDAEAEAVEGSVCAHTAVASTKVATKKAATARTTQL